jgi:hypothetical protein
MLSRQICHNQQSLLIRASKDAVGSIAFEKIKILSAAKRSHIEI